MNRVVLSNHRQMLFPDMFSKKLRISNYVPTGNRGKIALLCVARRPYLTLPPYTIITHLVERRQSDELVCEIVSHAHLFVTGYRCTSIHQRMPLVYTVCLKDPSWGLFLLKDPEPQDVTANRMNKIKLN
ncbi:hypothetical protein TNCV_5090631 [Trichonephila clavipes]|nr:hypothetical protein TNCV_5090631 [Trichonephila clavipes]